MTKLFSTAGAIIAAVIAFIVLFVILGVTLWVSILVAACILVVLGGSSMFTGHRPLTH